MRLLMIGLCVCSACSMASAAELSQIIVPEPASPAARLAAQELSTYLAKMNASRLVARTETGSQWPAQIVVCQAGSNDARQMQPPLADLPPESYALALRGNRLYLVGADERSVLYAAYDLLDRVGCRWLAPAFDFYQGSHEHVPQAPEVVLDLPDDVVCRPALKYRKLYVEEGHSHNTENLRQLVAWMPRLRFNTLVIPIDYQGAGRVRWDNWRAEIAPELKTRGIAVEVGGHGYQNFLNARMEDGRFFREHPEWFAMDANGRRTRSPAWVVCSSNPEAVAKLRSNVIAYLKSHPEIEIFDFWPPDGAKWCTCEACKVLGTPRERHALLVSQMAAALKDELPGVRLECIAYSSYLEPPARTPLARSILVDFCPISQSFETQVYGPVDKNNMMYAAALKKWRASFDGDISIYSYYRKYAWCSRPNIILHYMQKDLQYYRSEGVNGISSYAEPGDWFTYELNHYVLGHLAWEPDSDVDAVIREFCQARYVDEAALARDVFGDLEAVVRHGCKIPGTGAKTAGQYEAFLGTLKEDRQKIAAARERQKADPALCASLHRLELMLEYAERDIAIQRHATAGKPDAEGNRMIDDLAEFLHRHADEGVFLWHSRMEPRRRPRYFGAGRQ